MTHDRAFLHAILAEPDDDAHRLIFADWLEERGDPRGAFIRIQCALERLGPADPVRPELEDEERALLDRHEEEWTAPLLGVASAWRFRRGFVEEVTVTAEKLLSRGGAPFDTVPIQKVRLELRSAEAGAVAECPHLNRVRELDVSGRRLRDAAVATLLASSHLSRLTGLDLGDNWLENELVRALAASRLISRLAWLNLGGNHAVGQSGARALAQAPAAALQSLGLSRTNIGLVGLRDLLNSTTLTGLTELRAAGIGRDGVAGVSAAGLAEAPALSRLTTLDLGELAGPGGLSVLLRSPALGRLTSLSLAGCQLRDEGVRALAEAPHLAGLNALDLRSNGIGPVGAAALAESPHLARLTALRLGDNALRDKGAEALAESSHLRRLTLLDLHKNGVGGPGLRALAASPNLAHLTTLDLGENYVGLESVEALAASPHLGGLTHLRLNGNQLEPAAARALADSARFTRIAILDLDNNELGDEGLRELLCSPNLTRLTQLHVCQNGVGKAGADALAALIADSPRWPRLRELCLMRNCPSGREQRMLQQRLGPRVHL